MQHIPLDPDNLQTKGPRVPLNKLDQEILEQMLLASTLENGGKLLELVAMHKSELFDQDIVIGLLEEKKMGLETKRALDNIRESSARARKHMRKHMEEAIAAQTEQLRDFAGLGSKKY